MRVQSRRSVLGAAVLSTLALAAPSAPASATAPTRARLRLVRSAFTPHVGRRFTLSGPDVSTTARLTAVEDLAAVPRRNDQRRFSLLGTTYGGNGQTTFALPDLRGRLAVSSGQGPGLSNYDLGQLGGEEAVTLGAAELPNHTHLVTAHNNNGAYARPQGRVPGRLSGGTTGYAAAGNRATMAPTTINPTGGGQPHTNVQPYLTLNYCIALEGIFPSRN